MVTREELCAMTRNDKLYFNSKSADVAPGKGKGGGKGGGHREHVKHPPSYTKLRGMKNWRRVLSNFHEHPFEFEGERYNTIEHAFQSRKIAIANPAEALKFTMGSGHEIGQGDGVAARKNRKLVTLGLDQLALWDAQHMDVMARAAECKYQACAEAREVLMATHGAQLWHAQSRGGEPVRFTHLETIRARL